MLDAGNSNTTMSDAIPVHIDPSITWMCMQCRKDTAMSNAITIQLNPSAMRTNKKGKNLVLIADILLIEDVLTLLMMMLIKFPPEVLAF